MLSEHCGVSDHHCVCVILSEEAIFTAPKGTSRCYVYGSCLVAR